MKIERERRFTVRMGEYETYVFGAKVEVDHRDLGIGHDALAELDADDHSEMIEQLFVLCEQTLVEALVADVEEAATLTEDKRSFILRALDPKPQPPAEANRRRRKP